MPFVPACGKGLFCWMFLRFVASGREIAAPRHYEPVPRLTEWGWPARIFTAAAPRSQTTCFAFIIAAAVLALVLTAINR